MIAKLHVLVAFFIGSAFCAERVNWSEYGLKTTEVSMSDMPIEVLDKFEFESAAVFKGTQGRMNLPETSSLRRKLWKPMSCVGSRILLISMISLDHSFLRRAYEYTILTFPLLEWVIFNRYKWS